VNRSDIGKQRKREPAQHRGVARVAHEHFEEHRHDREADDANDGRRRDEQSHRRRHRAEIGANVDRVGDQQQSDQRIEQRRRIVLAHVTGESAPRHAPDLGADHLDRAHQRIGQQQRPTEAVAELRARLRIGGDAAGVVVGGAGNEAWPHDIGKLRSIRLLDRVRGGHGVDHEIPLTQSAIALR
jgi:hypothetical protein